MDTCQWAYVLIKGLLCKMVHFFYFPQCHSALVSSRNGHMCPHSAFNRYKSTHKCRTTAHHICIFKNAAPLKPVEASVVFNIWINTVNTETKLKLRKNIQYVLIFYDVFSRGNHMSSFCIAPFKPVVTPAVLNIIHLDTMDIKRFWEQHRCVLLLDVFSRCIGITGRLGKYDGNYFSHPIYNEDP